MNQVSPLGTVGLPDDPVRCCSEAAAVLGITPGQTGPIRLTTGNRQLFLDNYLLDRTERIVRRVHQPQKRGAVMRADKPWEGGSIQVRSGPSWHPEKQIWMLWYLPGGDDAYATSPDGIHWEKPVLGLREHDGSLQNNLLPDVEGGCLRFVFYDPHDSDPARRYKGFASRGPLHLRGNGFYPAVSPDGLAWQALKTNFIPSSDEAHLFHDVERGLFVATVKHQGPHGRSVYLSVSTDFEHWTVSRDCLIFHADQLDQELGAKRIQMHAQSPDLLHPVIDRPDQYQTDIYTLPVFRYEGVYVGLPTVYNWSGWTHDNSDGFSMTELAVSRDLLNWERVGGREKFLPLSPVEGGKNYDTGQLLAANAPIVHDQEIWFYYTALRWRTHPDYLKTGVYGDYPDSGAICLATLRRDGFTSLDAGDEPGAILTKPLVIDGKALHLNVEAASGEIRPEILDADGRTALAGFSREDAVPVRGDSLDAEVRWQNQQDLTSLIGQTVRLRFTMRNARLYSLWSTA